MFKIICSRCKSKISRNFDFCPYCGWNVKKRGEGLLDEIDDMKGMFSGLNLNVKDINCLFEQMKKEVLREDNREKERIAPKTISSGFSITITSGKGKNPMIDIKTHGMPSQKITRNEVKEIVQNIPEENVEKISKLPKVEPKSKVRRLSDKIVYEIDMPGVISLKDIFINKLSNSIEIKALSKNKNYSKIIPVSLPIKKYYLSDGKLILELKG